MGNRGGARPGSGPKPMDQKERFMRHVEKTESGCWLWKGAPTARYGIIYYNKKPIPSNRASWQIFKGIIPEGLFVCHHCDVPRCVNPEHLFLGTPKDNTQDMISKGRRVSRAGIGHKLSWDDVSEIRRRYVKGRGGRSKALHFKGNCVELAKEFGVDRSVVTRIVMGESWATHVSV